MRKRRSIWTPFTSITNVNRSWIACNSPLSISDSWLFIMIFKMSQVFLGHPICAGLKYFMIKAVAKALAGIGNDALRDVDSWSTMLSASLPIFKRAVACFCDHSEKSKWIGNMHSTRPNWVLLVHNRGSSYKLYLYRNSNQDSKQNSRQNNKTNVKWNSKKIGNKITLLVILNNHRLCHSISFTYYSSTYSKK